MTNDIEVLLVEDDPVDLRLMRRELEKDSRLRIEVARDGEEALELPLLPGRLREPLAEQSAQAGVVGSKMYRKSDGIQVLREIKSRPETRAIPVIALTSSREERDLVESYRLGVNSYIQKPVDFEKFRETIKTVGIYWSTIKPAAA